MRSLSGLVCVFGRDVVQPTKATHRGWFVNPFANNPWWCFFAAMPPALLAMILIFMDQQITAVIVNRKENKLRVSLNPSPLNLILQ